MTDIHFAETGNVKFSWDTHKFICTGENSQETNWCSHLKYFFENELDVPIFWDGNEPQAMGEFWIPYVPLHDQWALLQIQHGSDDADHIFRLFLGLPREGSGDQKYEFLGFVAPGEGVRVFRAMVHDWFQPRINYDAECQSPKHNYAAQNAWTKVMKSKDLSRKLAERWSVFYVKKCIFCMTALTNQGANDEDLVPDAAVTRSPWR